MKRTSSRAVCGWAFVFAIALAPAAMPADTQPPPTSAQAPATPSPAPNPPATPSPAPSPAASDASEDGQAVELTSRPAAYIEAKAKREEVYGAIMGSLAKIRAEVSKAGLKTQGHALAVFLEADDDGFTYRAMTPLESAPDPNAQIADPVKLGQTPVGKAMKFEHRGEYDDIDSTYDAITAYLDEKGVDAQDVFLEEYLNEPKTSDDPNLQVDIYVLIR
jgi:effector-binding domain-containing protein